MTDDATMAGYPFLPEDSAAATLVTRIWRPASGATPAGPSVAAIRGHEAWDISRAAPTVSSLLDRDDAVELVRNFAGERIGDIRSIAAAATERPTPADRPFLLAPVDLQAVKAAGVTFAVSLLERLIEEQAKGDPLRAETVRGELQAALGADLASVVPGSPQAEQLKGALISRGMWSQYLEVGIGPYAEIFTKAPPMSSVGYGADVGLRPESEWNNPEPEIVMVVNGAGRIVGATLGNDVNLRDIEGRSALLLGQAKDNNGSSSIGPLIRLFDAGYGLQDVRTARVSVDVSGPDQFRLHAVSDLTRISRDPAELVRQACAMHQYPDGMVLYTGTLFAPTQPRGADGKSFTHMQGDIVAISSPKLGTLVNRVGRCDTIPPWRFGTGALMRNLAARHLL